MDSAIETPEVSQDPTSSAPLTQAYMDKFLSELRAEIGSLKADFKSCMHNLKCNMEDSLGERVNDMEQALESRTEDLEALYRRISILEGQQINLQLKHKIRNIEAEGTISAPRPFLRAWKALTLYPL
ncbi:hypothetical protein NDU88_004742 [Pleurodeles waltl]|uniref:Uncharacterized protein n=1 Tax=Pleurodeles waltl TaxID=8319 RepID=A0AAV7SJS6_PLEWA|nr:hypothetical protein NDU88_004742 [Pleurodeles waltl]